MIASFRNSLGGWAARGLFVLLIAAFAVWGVGDVFRMMSGDRWVAKVGSRTIELPEVQSAYQRQMAQVSRMLRGQEATPEIRQSVLNQTLDRLITQTAILEEGQRLGLAVPEDAMRQAIAKIPAFAGPGGAFDLTTYQTILRNNGLTEPAFLALMRDDLINRQLMETVRAGAFAAPLLVDALFAVQGEQRSAVIAEFPFSAAQASAAPTEAQLERWWDNHPDLYSSPEYRRIKAVILSPETIAKDVTVDEADLRAFYDAHRADYTTPELRSAQVVTVPSEASARAIAQQWRGGAGWPAIEAAAGTAGGSAVALDASTKAAFPSDTLANEVFGAASGDIRGPAQGPLGWTVLRVGTITPGTDRSFADARDEIRARLAAERANDLLYERANRLDGLLAGGSTLDQLPDDLGAAAVEGTLDAQGRTLSGQPAPLPGAPELKAALIQAAFAAQKGDPARLTDVPNAGGGGTGYYAFAVEDVTPASPRPLDEVKDRVRADWLRDAARRAEEQKAAALLAAVKGGQNFADAARAAGVAIRTTPPAGRAGGDGAVPDKLLRPLFGLKPGEPAMVETPSGFVVAVVGEVRQPDPKSDPAGYARLDDVVAQAIATDAEITFATALRNRAQAKVNPSQLATIIQQQQ